MEKYAFKGTPGPWSIKMEHLEVESQQGELNESFHSYSGYILNGDSQAVGSVMGVKYLANGGGWVPYEAAEHNGHLIAAAPDLLLASIHMIEAVFCNTPKEMTAYIEMKNAIHKALNIQK